jgi:predicted dehydrogenase
MGSKVRIGIVGLGFGAEFIPIYQNHPDAELIAISQRNPETLKAIGETFKVAKRYSRFEEMVADPDIDAIHINTPIPDHAPMTLAALRAGKHVACTVPMATRVEDCLAIVAAARKAKRNYMMMETAVYTREFLFVKRLFDQGEMGKLQFLRGAHQQEMGGWPGYWEGLPPMHYATHAVSPLLAIAGKKAEWVTCLGSGRIADHLAAKYGSPFAVESALIRLKDSQLAAEITRSLFATAREYVESFDIYAECASFEWQQTESEKPVLFRGEKAERVTVPDFAHLLPEGIRRYTTQGVYDHDNNHLSFKQGSGHGGSHPHLAHEFIRSIMENRKSAIDEATSANWTSVGLCAHESATRGGLRIDLPDFEAV